MKNQLFQLFTDGGVTGRNPSSLGGTWSWCWVRDGEIVKYDAGVLEPKDLEVSKITNNQTELYAALRGLEKFGDIEEAEWWCDSDITIARFSKYARLNNVPKDIAQRVIKLRKRLRVKIIPCGGHPTHEELRLGRKIKNNRPTHIYNIWCDEMCSKLAYLHKLQGKLNHV